MKKILSLLMCVAMLVALTVTMTACGGEVPDKNKDNSSTVSVESKSESPVASSDEEMIVGAWTGKMSVSEDFAEEILGIAGGESDETSEMLEYFDINQLLSIDFTLTFNENGTYTISVTDEAVEKYVDTTVDVICDGMIEIMKDAAEESDMTWEEFLEVMEMTEQEYKDAVLAEVDKEEMIREFKDDFETETEYYKLEGGKLYTADDKDFEGDDLEISDYEITETTLTMTFENAVTATFTKVK